MPIHIKGIWDFDKTEIVDPMTGLPTGPSPDLRARVEAGLDLRVAYWGSLTATGFYDGIGVADFSAYGGSLKLMVPLQ
jgi:hypothetical protein